MAQRHWHSDHRDDYTQNTRRPLASAAAKRSLQYMYVSRFYVPRIYDRTRSLAVARIANRTGCKNDLQGHAGNLKANMRLPISDQ